jgi:hypothetical protein
MMIATATLFRPVNDETTRPPAPRNKAMSTPATVIRPRSPALCAIAVSGAVANNW